MLKNFISTLTLEVLHFLKKHDDFFAGDKATREKALANIRIPAVFKHYLADTKEADFLSDLHVMIRFSNRSDAPIKDNKLMLALVDFFTGPFASKLDMIFTDFYTMSEKDRLKVVEALIKSDTRLGDSLRNLLLRYTYQELGEGIQSLAQKVAGSPMILVQSPREMEAELKKEMRGELVKETPRTFPVFQINRKLIGGVRVFNNGDVVDHSWLNRVLRFTSLTSA